MNIHIFFLKLFNDTRTHANKSNSFSKNLKKTIWTNERITIIHLTPTFVIFCINNSKCTQKLHSYIEMCKPYIHATVLTTIVLYHVYILMPILTKSSPFTNYCILLYILFTLVLHLQIVTLLNKIQKGVRKHL